MRRRSTLLLRPADTNNKNKTVYTSFQDEINQNSSKNNNNNPWKKGEEEILAQLPKLREMAELRVIWGRKGGKRNPPVPSPSAPVLPTGQTTSTNLPAEEEQRQENPNGGPRRSARPPKRKRWDSYEEEEGHLPRPAASTSAAPFNKANPNDTCRTPTKEEEGHSSNVLHPLEGGNNIAAVPALPVEVTADYFKGKDEFGSTVGILVDTEDPEEIKGLKLEKGWLQCGLCWWFGEVTDFSQYKKLGALICQKCTTFFQKMNKVAMKAEALICKGNGACIVQPCTDENEYCEGCFMRNCLLLFDLTDLDYYKLWRATPPSCKEKVPFAPPQQKRYPNRGNVIFANRLGGAVIHQMSLSSGKGLGLTTVKKQKIVPVITDPQIQGTEVKHGRGRPRKNAKPVKSEINLNESNQKTERLTAESVKSEMTVKVFPPTSDVSQEIVEQHGYPVAVIEGNEPPYPLCFSCGSAGVNQLVFCCLCFQPYHPYCSDDDILLTTYLNSTTSTTGMDTAALSQRFRKWKCQGCINCSYCGTGKEKDVYFIGCSICLSAFHVKCAKRMPLKPGDREKDKWVCAGCLQCASCQVPLTRKSQHLRQILNSAANTHSEILCLECLRARQKGSFCPVCLSCYDDDDWDTKMMECDACKRWIHAHCEHLNEERYLILGTLPESIPYVCRICLPPSSVGWRFALETELNDGCFRVLELFHKKAVGLCRKRKSLVFDDQPLKDEPENHLSPGYFTPSLNNNSSKQNDRDEILEDTRSNKEVARKLDFGSEGSDENVPLVKSPEDHLIDRFKIKPCVVKLVELDGLLNSKDNESPEMKFSPEIIEKISTRESEALQVTPKKSFNVTTDIYTPLKFSTPNRIFASFTEAVKTACNAISSVKGFRDLATTLLPNYLVEMAQSGTDCDNDKYLQHFDDTLRQVFPWWKEDLKDLIKKDINDNEEVEHEEEIQTKIVKDESTLDTIAFENIYWDDKRFLDNRKCVLCLEQGDFPFTSCGRLLYINPEEWIHINCILWSSEVWEEEDGSLQQVESAIIRGLKSQCALCFGFGATLNCCAGSCRKQYHFLCALESDCSLQVDKGVFCSEHSCHAKGEAQRDMQVTRKVFISTSTALLSKRKLWTYPLSTLRLFLGSVCIENLGYLVPISAKEASSSTLLVPVDFGVSLLRLNNSEENVKKYLLEKWRTSLNTTGDFRGKDYIDKPSNYTVVIDHTQRKDKVQSKWNEAKEFWEWITSSTRYIDEYNMEWAPVYKPLKKTLVNRKRRKSKTATLVDEDVDTVTEVHTGVHRATLDWNPPLTVKESMLLERVLSQPRLKFLTEQLPGVESIGDKYKFQFFASARREEDIPANPTVSGSARTEGFVRSKPYEMFSWLRSKHRAAPVFHNLSTSDDWGKTKGLLSGIPMAMRFRGLRERASKDLIVLPSGIHGRGLFARRDFQEGEMLIEYAGEVIRSSLCDTKEKKYERAGIGCYMFRINRDRVVDATMKGNAARFINHSCEPNCESKVVRILGKDHILIFALRRIGCSEELTYDYKFEREIDGKLPCSCGTKKCRRYLN